MKEQYYLVSQLPDISAAGEKSSLPITEKYYRDLCSRFFDARQNEILNKLSLEAPKLPESTGSVFLDNGTALNGLCVMRWHRSARKK